MTMECLSEYLKEIFTGFVLVVLSGLVIYYLTSLKPIKKKNLWLGLNDLEEKIKDKYIKYYNVHQPLQYANRDIQKKMKKNDINKELEDYFDRLFNSHKEAKSIGVPLIKKIKK